MNVPFVAFQYRDLKVFRLEYLSIYRQIVINKKIFWAVYDRSKKEEICSVRYYLHVVLRNVYLLFKFWNIFSEKMILAVGQLVLRRIYK